LRIPIFARSNIYWDDTAQKLTFVPAADNPAQNNDTKAGYQGVLFKWGSLVGISPVMTAQPNPDDFLSTTPIYVPVVNSTLTSSTWNSTTTAAKNWTNAFADIPCMDSSYGGTSTERNNTHLIDPERNDLTTYNALRGDICQYLSKTGAVTGNYRLPVSYEFGENSTGWEFATSFSYPTGNAEGTFVVQGYVKNTTMDDVFLPHSGGRLSSGTLDGSAGYVGNYWSGSANGVTLGMLLVFNHQQVSTFNSYYREMALSVRCVKY
jgi:hypothetical protein